jgi:hypothetical protein
MFSINPNGAVTPSVTLHALDRSNCQTKPISVSDIPCDELSDEDRERLIRRAGRMMRLYMARYERSSCFADRGVADYWRMTMQADIKARSPAQVAKLERERGLS